MGGTLVVDGCHSHGESWTGSIPVTREFCWDSDFDEVGLGSGVPVVYVTRVCLEMHVVIAQLSSLALRRGSKRVVTLATFASSRV